MYNKYMKEEKMISFKEFLKNNTLYVFDMDDTLFSTNTLIHIRDSSGKIVKSINSAEFTTHKLLPGQSYDTSEFEKADQFEMTSKPIIPMLARMKLFQATDNDIVIVTGRADFDDKEKFLNVFRKLGIDIDRIHVYRVGNDHGPENIAVKKCKVIRRLLDTHKYNHVVMYDDSLDNLNEFKNLNKEFTNISFNAYQAFHDGTVKVV